MDLDEFIEVHYRSLLRTAFLLTGDRYAGEDLLQDVLAASRGRPPPQAEGDCRIPASSRPTMRWAS